MLLMNEKPLQHSKRRKLLKFGIQFPNKLETGKSTEGVNKD